MILVYPMLVSQNISSHVLPGICKVLERFVIIYDLDNIAKKFSLGKVTVGAQNASAGIQSLKTLAGMIAMRARKESYDSTLLDETTAVAMTADELDKFLTKQRGNKINALPVDGTAEREDKGSKSSVPRMNASMDVKFPDHDGLSVEPTFVIVNTQSGTKVIGIKVIPYPVKSTEELGSMLMSDMSLKTFDEFMYKNTRKIFRFLYGVARTLSDKIPFLGDKVITGDPEKDILFASTKYKNNVFCLLNQQDLENDEVFKKAGGVSKLFNLGWNSILINDDVNKKTSFCMKQFGGLCSSVPHSYLFASFGKEHLKVYEKMDDIQKVTSPFFKQKIKPSKIFSEMVAEFKKFKYSNNNECDGCEEGWDHSGNKLNKEADEE
jgi:hypothetical protein